jgi:hypothetical protein
MVWAFNHPEIYAIYTSYEMCSLTPARRVSPSSFQAGHARGCFSGFLDARLGTVFRVKRRTGFGFNFSGFYILKE